MNYDDWKLRSPCDEYPDEECWHEEYEADWEGRARCDMCGHSWWPSDAETNAKIKHIAAYQKHLAREERREWVEGLIHKLAVWRRWRKPEPINDEIPF